MKRRLEKKQGWGTTHVNTSLLLYFAHILGIDAGQIDAA